VLLASWQSAHDQACGLYILMVFKTPYSDSNWYSFARKGAIGSWSGSNNVIWYVRHRAILNKQKVTPPGSSTFPAVQCPVLLPCCQSARQSPTGHAITS